jgi:hypothetical protein
MLQNPNGAYWCALVTRYPEQPESQPRSDGQR